MFVMNARHTFYISITLGIRICKVLIFDLHDGSANFK